VPLFNELNTYVTLSNSLLRPRDNDLWTGGEYGSGQTLFPASLLTLFPVIQPHHHRRQSYTPSLQPISLKIFVNVTSHRIATFSIWKFFAESFSL